MAFSTENWCFTTSILYLCTSQIYYKARRRSSYTDSPSLEKLPREEVLSTLSNHVLKTSLERGTTTPWLNLGLTPLVQHMYWLCKLLFSATWLLDCNTCITLKLRVSQTLLTFTFLRNGNSWSCICYSVNERLAFSIPIAVELMYEMSAWYGDFM